MFEIENKDLYDFFNKIILINYEFLLMYLYNDLINMVEN